ncbi:hypothetical protein ACFY5C_03110 [Streptomyces sp. NPDC012935]|uniref:hypothetical protein n=1 Tax=Streptomyces sp. NPDC012935 TaxID=3364857 RepID=UPI0036B51688
MAEDTQDDGAFGRSVDPAEDAAEHLAAAIGTPAWAEAREGVLGLLPDDEPQVNERIDAWAAVAARREGEGLTRYLTESLPEWRELIERAVADDPERAEEARRFADSIQSLLPSPDATPQIAVATGHGTVNAVQNGNIYYEVVLGLAPRPPRRTSLGKTAVITGGAAATTAVGGHVVADHLATEAVKAAGTGSAPGAPLADPTQAAGTAAQTAGSTSAAGVSAPGAAAAAKGGATVLAKAAAAVTKALTFAGAGVSVPVVASVVTVVVVVTVTVTVVVPRVMGGASCDKAAEGRSAPAVLAEAARRVELTSFRYDVTRGRHHVAGAADPHARTAWFRQGLTGGPVTSGTIDRGRVVLPTGTTTPSGVDPRWVRADGAFMDAVDPAAPARELRTVTRARREGCTFTGTLAPSAEPSGPSGTAEPAVARSNSGPITLAAATSTPRADDTTVDFTARIDDLGRLVRLTTRAAGDRLPASARYWDFGLTVTPSAPPSGDGSKPSGTATLTGAWTGDWSTGFGTGGFTATLSQDGNRLTGELKVDGVPCSLDGALNGTLDGDRITFGSVNSAKEITFTGSVDGDTMRGTFETDCYDASGPWTARRSDS